MQNTDFPVIRTEGRKYPLTFFPGFDMLIVLGRSFGLPIFYPGGDFLDIPYTLIRSSRRTISIEITPEGRLLVRSPRQLSDRAVREFVLSREHWIREKLAKAENRPRPPKLTKEELEALMRDAERFLVK